MEDPSQTACFDGIQTAIVEDISFCINSFMPLFTYSDLKCAAILTLIFDSFELCRFAFDCGTLPSFSFITIHR